MTALQRIRDALAVLTQSTLPGVPVVTTEEAAFANSVTRAVVIQPLDAQPVSGYPMGNHAVDQPFSVTLIARGSDPIALIEAMDSALFAVISDSRQLGDAVKWEWLGDRWEHSQMSDANYAIKRVIWKATYLTERGRRI
ncbi:hypothetical protein HQN60_12625 [Deefgea piscis]|uniref:DUF3168 domain-containing protein n=1 Tax=Deefgea piscis TaxID=2739061 RepID=A0A6M8SQE1_9NEIS|nr:hypothetical protein [Deefgea piscis]QKJ67482.1 hypothetical protein HQN60_12625 [Deefgea piscis]